MDQSRDDTVVGVRPSEDAPFRDVVSQQFSQDERRSIPEEGVLYD